MGSLSYSTNIPSALVYVKAQGWITVSILIGFMTCCDKDVYKFQGNVNDALRDLSKAYEIIAEQLPRGDKECFTAGIVFKLDE
jgi:hypothetical protein